MSEINPETQIITKSLYWVVGVDEDWFVIAETLYDAELCFSNFHGCDVEDCYADDILEIEEVHLTGKKLKNLVTKSIKRQEAETNEIIAFAQKEKGKKLSEQEIQNIKEDSNVFEYLITMPKYAELEDLKTLGFEILVEDSPRTVSLGDKVFVEGTLDYDIEQVPRKLKKKRDDENRLSRLN